MLEAKKLTAQRIAENNFEMREIFDRVSERVEADAAEAMIPFAFRSRQTVARMLDSADGMAHEAIVAIQLASKKIGTENRVDRLLDAMAVLANMVYFIERHDVHEEDQDVLFAPLLQELMDERRKAQAPDPTFADREQGENVNAGSPEAPPAPADDEV